MNNSMGFKTLIFNIDKGIAKITLSRPDAKNSINVDMGHDLMDVALRCSEDRQIRAIALTGSGSFFVRVET